MAYCVNCGQQLKDGAKFCPKCGTKSEVPSQQEAHVQQECNYSYSMQNYGRGNNNGYYWIAACVIILIIVAIILNNNRDSDYNSDYYIENVATTTPDVEEVGYNDGYEFGFAFANEYTTEGAPSTSYDLKFGAPVTSEEKQLYKIYEKAYKRGFQDGKRAKYQ